MGFNCPGSRYAGRARLKTGEGELRTWAYIWQSRKDRGIVPTTNEKLRIFDRELSKIRSRGIRILTEECLLEAPEYFWRIPASSSGKYHPPWANRDGGLVLHTKVVTYLVKQLFKMIIVDPSWLLDICYSAAILHDIAKNGLPDSGYTTTDHGASASIILWTCYERTGAVQGMVSLDEFCQIHEAIRLHYGVFTDKKEVRSCLQLSGPSLIVHLADAIAAEPDFSLPSFLR